MAHTQAGDPATDGSARTKAKTPRIRVRLTGSEIGSTTRQRQTIRGLGLRKIGEERVLPKTPAVLGMVEKVAHLLEVEETKDAD